MIHRQSSNRYLVSMALSLHMLAPRSNFPFTGGFSARVSSEDFWIAGCGYIARETGVRKAFLPARHIQNIIEKTGTDILKDIGDRERRDILEELWNAIVSIPAENLGRKRGSDISIVIAVGDQDGMHACASGISGIWGQSESDEKWHVLLPQRHPMFQVDGIVGDFPGALCLKRSPKTIMTTAKPLFPMLPPKEELYVRLGVTEL